MCINTAIVKCPTTSCFDLLRTKPRSVSDVHGNIQNDGTERSYERKITTLKTGNIDVTSYVATFEVQRKANGEMRFHGKITCPDKETDVRVRGRFHEALDRHFFFYRHNHPERRKAICEEIERSIVAEYLALACFWENFSLQNDINTWMR